MRTTIIMLALAAGASTAAACTAQSSPQQNAPETAAQANAAILAQTTQTQVDAPMPGRGRRGGRMMRADANGDGVVTRAEAVAEADRRFDRLDTNHDNQIAPAEMQASRDAMRQRMEARGADMPPPPPGGPKHMPGMGRRADPDGNGVITKAEFGARAGSRFDRMDANHDGRLDQTEIAARAEMRRDRRERAEGAAADDAPPSPDE